ncbi:phage major capsid protein [Lacticaseibacillus paracasei]|uniref:phage major capsid protein n=1 Tax=Lacticaseibacillus paracasei TaxID=1597 RepID=UPI0008FF3E92|nr:phage major capsid protein [Lacticaseibacillus paracasei]ATG98285.1 phage capsid protein [Lacticaseibacillus paracasei]OJF74750.1 phage capsid protein [Lacticaseibacillus casei]RND78748.1 phage major capsid protein, HK97 family [Lacticaseibacillus paracasei]RND86487.1 phage major capsid protein, HK97 family [Lacticaseibacillus paracasei]
MNKEEYLKQREALMNDARTAIDKGKSEDANKAMKSVKDLDAKWDQQTKDQANLASLDDHAPITLAQVAPANDIVGVGKSLENTKLNTVAKTQPTYDKVWAKTLLGHTLNTAEQAVFDKENARLNGAPFSHQTGNTPTLIPNTVAAGIWKIAEEQYPAFADAKKFNVSGTLTINKHDGIVSGDAQWVDENTQADDEQNKFSQLVLKGYELNKVATVSWKMKSMSEEDFISFLTQELGDRLGVALGVAIHQGDGKNSPLGIETALKAEKGTPQVATYKDQIAYKDITSTMAKIHSSFAGKAAVYANSKTIWNQLANIVDGQGRPLFIASPINGGVGSILGLVVKPDAGVNDGDVLIADVADTVVVNINQALTVATEDHVKGRSTDYGAYAIADAGLLTTKGAALLTAGPKV